MRKSTSLHKKLISLFAISLFLLIGLYIVQINSLTENAYAATSFEKEFSQLQETNKNFQASMAKSFSVQSVSELASKLHFEKIDIVSYVQVLEGSVAKRPSSNE